MFLGEDRHNIDPKGRLVLPARHRNGLEDGCVVAMGREKQLMVYPLEVYDAKAKEVRALPETPRNLRIARLFFGKADTPGVDKAGRLLLRQDLRDFAELEPGGEVVVIGMYDHLELWSPAAYEADQAMGDEVYLYDEDETEER